MASIEEELDAALLAVAILKSENARYREALEKIENDIECSCRYCVGCDQGSKMSLCAGEALKEIGK